jgi:membrane associated rhomboid family serine protease
MDRKGQLFPLKDDNPLRNISTPFVNWVLIGINILAFLFSLTAFEYFIMEHGFTPANFQFTDILTSMFLHGGIAHIFGNMWFLLIFGDNVEDALGHWVYLAFYLLAGIAASFSHYLLNIGSVVPAVGASGAISGVLGAYLVFYPTAGVYVSGGYSQTGKVSAKLMLLLWFGFQFLSGVMGYFGNESGIAFWAHIGGFVFGMLFAWIWKAFSKEKIRSTLPR